MVETEQKFEVGDEVKILNNGFSIRNIEQGQTKIIKSFDNLRNTNYPHNINFTDDSFGAMHQNGNWNRYLKLVKKKDVLSSLELW